MLQYSTSGTNSYSFTGDTKSTLISGIEVGLLASSWTEISRTAGVDITFQSVATPQSNQIQVRVWDDGTSNCVRVRLSNVAGTLVQSGSCFLFPAASKVWRIVSSGYQFACWVPTSTSARDFVICSALYIPGFLNSGAPPLTTAAIVMGNANSDIDATTRGSFRTCLSGRDVTGGLCNGFGILNGASVEWAGGSTPYCGTPAVALLQSSETLFTTGNLWHDGSCAVPEPLIAWGSPAISNPAMIRGQLWDAMIATDSFPMDETTVFDGHNWVNLTNNNAGTDGQQMAGSLWVVTP